VAIRKAGQRTKRGGPDPVEQETRGDAGHGRGLTMVDPWAMLLEQLMEVPANGTGSGEGPEDRRAARAQPEAESAIKPRRPKKGKGSDEQG
jgi:hypothetical protein